ncbi:hypothetical protein ABPG72_022699 [Tetrahymena utriculariae]
MLVKSELDSQINNLQFFLTLVLISSGYLRINANSVLLQIVDIHVKQILVLLLLKILRMDKAKQRDTIPKIKLLQVKSLLFILFFQSFRLKTQMDSRQCIKIIIKNKIIVNLFKIQIKSDGIMGMGVSKKESLVNKLFMEKKIEKNQFSFKLSSIDLSQYSKDQQNMATDTNSQLILGGYDEQLISEDSINYFQVVSKNYWAIKMRSARYNKQDIFNAKNELRLALIDTGTSLIHMPTSDFQVFNRTVLEKSSNKGCFEFGLIICVCNQKQVANFPTISLKFTDIDNNDQIINILPEYYIIYQDGFCIYLVAEFPDMGISNMWILGDVFMRQTYNIFDYDRQAIGIVNMVPEDEEGHQIKSDTFSGFGKLVIMLLVIGIGAFLANYIYQNYIKNNSNNDQQNNQDNYQQYQPQQSYQPPQQYYQQQPPPQQYYQQPSPQYNNQNYQNIPLQPLNQQQQV